jgi:pimeloyl-ACP methyl ester carboxylesterase
MTKKNLPKLAFQTYGTGAEALLAFHGYGQDHRVYEGLGVALQHRYTVYSFDLFLHGERPESINQIITVAHWQQSISEFLESHGIVDFSLVGYSLGARFALTLVEAMAARINQLILIAPDGIKSSRWYQLASGSRLGNHLLRHTVVSPRPFFWALRKAYQLKAIEKSVVKFVESHMNTRADRLWVYRRWVTFRHIQPNLREVKRQCNVHRVEVAFFLGEYDAIVKKKAITSFHKSLINSKLHSLPCGHAALIDKVTDYYLSNG